MIISNIFKFKGLCFLLLIVGIKVAAQQSASMSLTVDAGKITHQMKGGIGASWHALIKDIPLENEKYDYPVKFSSPRGSAFAGNPPLTDTAAWKQLYHHATWLGLDFVRVELSQHMYEPNRNAFDWNNDEMRALYRILDWCEANHADVFLQQMWGHVAWNAHSGVHPLLSSPKSIDDFAFGITSLLKYLTLEKKYTCIKYFSMTNEPPGGTWGYWWNSGREQGTTLTAAWKKLNQSFTENKISIPLSGPDWTDLPPLKIEKIDFDQYLGAFDIHSYKGIYNRAEQTVTNWVNWAKTKNKPFFITEIGNMKLGWGADNIGPKTFKASLSDANDIATCMNIGVDAFNRWSFTNRGDLDGQWQLVRTYDILTKTYLKTIIPENEAYYGYAMLTRFMGKYAAVLESTASNKVDSVVFTSYKNRDGSVSVLVINNKKEPVSLNLNIKNKATKGAFKFYQVTENVLKNASFKLEPQKTFRDKNQFKNIVLQPESISVITTNALNDKAKGTI